MVFKLLPMSKTVIDWELYLRTATEALGRSPTATLDEQRHQFTRSLPDYIATLKEVELKGGNPHSPGGVQLEHIHQGFMLIASRQATYSIVMKSRVAASTAMSIHDDFNLTILSGTLGQWRSAILNCCVDEVSFDVRSFGMELLIYFDSVGLKRYMLDAIQVQLGDGTVRLLERK
jgi:hypothetical protein